MDGFRVDVAHAPDQGPVRAAAQSSPSWHGELPLDGSHPLWDRDEVHEIYAEWREVFNEYDPPRTAVAEAWVHAARRARYARPTGLGQAFNFDLLQADFDAGAVPRRSSPATWPRPTQSGASSTWVFSNHDVVRHATRYGLPGRAADLGRNGCCTRRRGAAPELDVELGLRRARAATLLMLALPGSAYLYQGEELGLHEVADIPPTPRCQDPILSATYGVEKGRDGCRVPLPWTATAPPSASATAAPHLPQPAWFGRYAVASRRTGVQGSTLELYRQALQLRRELQTAEELEWVDTGNPRCCTSVRPGGWHCVTNFGAQPWPARRRPCCSAAGRSPRAALAYAPTPPSGSGRCRSEQAPTHGARVTVSTHPSRPSLPRIWVHSPLCSNARTVTPSS